MRRKFGCLIVGALLAVTVACSGGPIAGVQAQGSEQLPPTTGDGAPQFEVDPFWPKPLPNNWLLGSTIGVAVDSDDHVWIVHRGNLGNNEIPAALDPPLAEECCFPAPPILEFDAEGNLLQHWGGPGEGFDWPDSNHGIFVDHMNNVWIGGNGGADSHALKFSHNGEFLMQIGEGRFHGCRQQLDDALLEGRQGHGRPRGQRGVSRRRLREPARRGRGRRHR